jgi:hypothetical protein
LRPLDFEKDIAIDESALELEWIDHSALYMRYCQASAAANKLAKECYHVQKVTYARLALEATDALVALNQKVNDGTRDAWVLLHPDHAAATAARFKAEHDAEQIQNAVYAFGHRKGALQELCALDARAYFSRPREPRNLTAEVKEEWLAKKNAALDTAREATSSNVRERINSRRNNPNLATRD